MPFSLSSNIEIILSSNESYSAKSNELSKLLEYYSNTANTNVVYIVKLVKIHSWSDDGTLGVTIENPLGDEVIIYPRASNHSYKDWPIYELKGTSELGFGMRRNNNLCYIAFYNSPIKWYGANSWSDPTEQAENPELKEKFNRCFSYNLKSKMFGCSEGCLFPLIGKIGFYNKLSEEYSYNRINHLNTVLKTFFKKKKKSDYLLKNPCLKVEIKGNKSDIVNEKRKKVEILSEEEISKIKESIKETNMELIVLLDLATGLRLGELLALDWSVIDLENKNLRVERSVKEVYVYDDENHRHLETVFQIPKTPHSFRTVPIPNTLVETLKDFDNKNGLVFHNERGKPLRAKNIAYHWKKILKECNIPHKKFHTIRHTYGSILLKNGVDIETVAELMGHSAISITQIYLHSTNNQKQDAANKLNYLF